MHSNWTKWFMPNINHQLWIIFNFWVWVNIGKEMTQERKSFQLIKRIGLEVEGKLYFLVKYTNFQVGCFNLSSLCHVAEMVRRQALFPGDSEFQQLLHIFRCVYDQSQSSLYFSALCYCSLVKQQTPQAWLLMTIVANLLDFQLCF